MAVSVPVRGCCAHGGRGGTATALTPSWPLPSALPLAAPHFPTLDLLSGATSFPRARPHIRFPRRSCHGPCHPSCHGHSTVFGKLLCELQQVSRWRGKDMGTAAAPCQGQGQGHGRACTALPAESSAGARCAHQHHAWPLGPPQTNRGAVCTANTAAEPQTPAAVARPGCAGARWTRQDPPQEQLEQGQAPPRQSHVLGKCGWECGFLMSWYLPRRN